MRHRKAASWLYMSRLAALKEYAFMKALYEYGFPVPRPVDNSRHCVIMTLAKGFPLCQVADIRHPGKVYSTLMKLIIRLAQHGLIHCDFNEFNLMIDDEENITLIDFPQMVSTTHENADFYFDRDVQCIRTYFARRYNFVADDYPKFEDYSKRTHDLDIAVEASGFHKKLQSELESFIDRETTEQDDAAAQGQEFEEFDSDQEGEMEDEDGFLLPEDQEGSDTEEEHPSFQEESEEAKALRKDKIEEMRRQILLQQRVENSPSQLIPLIGEDTELETQEDIDLLNQADQHEAQVTSEENVEQPSKTAPKAKKPKARAAPASEDVRNRVRQGLVRRNKPKLKPNTNKSRAKRNDRVTIAEDS